MSTKRKRLEIFIGLFQYLVFNGKKMNAEDYPKGGIIESDAEILEDVLDDEDRDIIREAITKEEIRFTAFITDRECREFLMAIDKDRMIIQGNI